MPEGDTVWRAGRRLDDALADRVLTVSDFRVPQLATVDLRGRHVSGVASRGKHLLTRIEGDLTLHTHFRMDGTWRVQRVGERWRGGPVHQVRVVLANQEWQALGFRLPVVELLPTAQEYRVVGHLGPDLLATDWNDNMLAEAVSRLMVKPERKIGEALLDQRNIAGIGNLYKTEVCFICGISPWTRVGDVPDIRAIVTLAQNLLDRNRHHGQQITTGDRRRGNHHWIFERAGRPCRKCGTLIKTAPQGAPPPYSRVSYWCPRCQPEAGHPDPPSDLLSELPRTPT